MQGFRVLLIESNQDDLRLFSHLIETGSRSEFEVIAVDDLARGMEALVKKEIDALILDLALPGAEELDTFRLIRTRYPQLPIILIANSQDERLASEAIQSGAQDYFLKSELSASLLARAIRYAIERQAQETKITSLNDDLERRIIELACANQELDTLSKNLTLARDQALQASSYKSEFLARMNHDIRTPLSSSIGAVELLKSTELDADQKELLDLVEGSNASLLKIVNQDLNYANMEASEVGLDYTDFSMVKLVEDAAELMAPLAVRKGISMMTYIDPVITSLLGDPVRVKQILLNLISNAAKFTEKGEILIRATRESYDQESVLVRIAVIDTGCGIEEENIKEYFDRQLPTDIGSDGDSEYEQNAGFAELRHSNSGLGLAISKQLVDMMGGQIGATSIPEKGSTFWFSIRFRKGRPVRKIDAIPLHAMVSNSLAGYRILVVDGSDNARIISRSYLLAAGFKATAAASAGEALEILRHASSQEEPFQVAIIDLDDSKHSVALADEIQKDPSISRTRLIYMTSKRQPATELWSRGFSSYLTKPLRQTALISSIVDVTLGQVEEPDKPKDRKEGNGKKSLKEGTKILVVEDNSYLQVVVGKVLHRLGCQVDRAENGKEAVDLQAANNYSLILMDCQMPVMDGFEATRRIREREKDSSIRTPIVAMTASIRQSDREACMRAGMDDFLSKPVTIDKLQEVLSSLC